MLGGNRPEKGPAIKKDGERCHTNIGQPVNAVLKVVEIVLEVPKPVLDTAKIVPEAESVGVGSEADTKLPWIWQRGCKSEYERTAVGGNNKHSLHHQSGRGFSTKRETRRVVDQTGERAVYGGGGRMS